MSRNRIAVVALTGAAAAGLVLGGAALSDAATGSGGSSTATSQSPGGANHTPVTGSELSKVVAAVKAKDSALTVSSVRKDPDGSYDVFGTKSGAQVRYEVSADLKTITQGDDRGGPGGPGGPGGHGGPGGASNDTPVTGGELSKVTAAMKAKDSSVTVTSVRKDPDGSYDVFGTKSGSQVKYDVSKDLTTFTQDTHQPGGPAGSAPAA